jgi:hypothetical protein
MPNFYPLPRERDLSVSWYFARLTLEAFLKGVRDRQNGQNFACNPYPTNRHGGVPYGLRESYALGNMWAQGYWFGESVETAEVAT